MAMAVEPALAGYCHNASFLDWLMHQSIKTSFTGITGLAKAPNVLTGIPAPETEVKLQGNNPHCMDANAYPRRVHSKEWIGNLYNINQPDIPAYASLLEACANTSALAEGRQIHSRMIVNGIEEHRFLANKLVGMYARCRSTVDARLLFDRKLNRSGFLWNVMIRACARDGFWDDALTFYYQMQEAGRQPDRLTFPCVLKACAGLSALQQGREIHGNVITVGCESDVFVGNALVAMYGKCGSIEDARHVFDKMSQRNVVSWTAMIAAYGMHGHAEDALGMFLQMQQAGTKPDRIAFTAVLAACSHGGLLDQGRTYFDSMTRDYNIEPSLEHYACMVDLLGRVGHLKEAEEFITRIPLEPDAGVWGALLGACRIHCNVDLGERVAAHIFELEPENAGYYALLSNIYARAGRWERVAHVRSMLKVRGLKKPQGCSWIEKQNRFYSQSLKNL